MKLGETNPNGRHIKFTIRTADGSDFATSVDQLSPAPTVLVASNSSTLVVAGGTFTHVLNEPRQHVYIASAAEALIPGFLLVVVLHSTIQNAIASTFVGQVFKVGETDPNLLRLPCTIFDNNQPPGLAIGAVVVLASDLQSSINDSAFSNDGGSLHEIGHGAYFWQALAPSASTYGSLSVKYDATGFGVMLSGVDVSLPEAADVTAPVISIISPLPNTVIGQSTQIVFTYSDEIGLRRPLPCARFVQPDGSLKYELIHDGDNFTPDYQGTKTIVRSSPPIFQYAVTRKGGWGAILSYHGGAPTLVPFGTDTGGNEPA